MEEKIAEHIEKLKKHFQYLAYSGTKKIKRYRRAVGWYLHPKEGSGWRDKALYRWNMAELVDFFRSEIRVSSTVIHRLEESEIDGSIMEMTLNSDDGDEALQRALKVDALVVRKIRRKLDEMGKDHGLERHKDELRYFFDKAMFDSIPAPPVVSPLLMLNVRVAFASHRRVAFKSTCLLPFPPFLSLLAQYPHSPFPLRGLDFTEEARLKAQIRSVAKGVEREGKLLPRHLNQGIPKIRQKREVVEKKKLNSAIRAVTEELEESEEFFEESAKDALEAGGIFTPEHKVSKDRKSKGKSLKVEKPKPDKTNIAVLNPKYKSVGMWEAVGATRGVRKKLAQTKQLRDEKEEEERDEGGEGDLFQESSQPGRRTASSAVPVP
ncbi:hypothetical protein GUITHDRAFT_133523 [Guillardia theta CCMP2712]|uniref:Uncharacterized protein n=1 Tax=Guillardia theta (strain CCMP2712) TaxID=905079 RepID=L1JV38_GUITC|nr:hypothetical protein GUITHDRAFT_133523 [Guillardia theta CCMP2712]EKX52431.1 hypothetical protein GUITHDRAFT_133523 [Guillardia theta CCMP2712]|eukprot:XP_005839411.1 hypothetical protein GUITHDRAFT_133523 [Guillardia theta CCMP2712]